MTADRASHNQDLNKCDTLVLNLAISRDVDLESVKRKLRCGVHSYCICTADASVPGLICSYILTGDCRLSPEIGEMKPP